MRNQHWTLQIWCSLWSKWPLLCLPLSHTGGTATKVKGQSLSFKGGFLHCTLFFLSFSGKCLSYRCVVWTGGKRISARIVTGKDRPGNRQTHLETGEWIPAKKYMQSFSVLVVLFLRSQAENCLRSWSSLNIRGLKIGTSAPQNQRYNSDLHSEETYRA